jgi:Protein of unknown function (DUF2505)
MKKVHEELRYDGATIEQVHEMLATPAFREAVCDAIGVLRHTVQVERNDPAMTVTIDQVQRAQGIPGFAKKFVGDEINIVQAEDWSAPEKGNIHVTIPGKPGEMTGTALLTEDPDGTTETVNMTVKVNIPLVSGKIEGLIADLLGKALRAEHSVGVKWLADRS